MKVKLRNLRKSFSQLRKFIESRFQRGELSTLSYLLHIYHTLHRNDSLDGIRDLEDQVDETNETYNPRYKNIRRVHKFLPQRASYLSFERFESVFLKLRKNDTYSFLQVS